MRKIKNYSYIVNKQFKVNRKRNISTISGIILSIILFTIVGYIQNYYQEVSMIDAKNRNGNYEAVLKNMSIEDIERLKNNTLIDKVGLYTEKYNSTIKIDDKEKNIKIYSLDNTALKELFSPIIKLKNGRLPEKKNEILLDSVGEYFSHKNVGDSLKLGKEDYKIVGTYEKNSSPEPYTIEIITYFNKEENLKNINAAFNVITKTNKEKTIRKIADDLGIKDENYKEKRLLFNGLILRNNSSIDSTNNILNEEKLIEIMLYGAILALTVFMTYDSINTSIKERIVQFSILRCMGATPSKIRNLLIRESFLLSLLSIIPGVLLGQLICFFISSVILKNIFTTTITYKIYPSVIGTVVLLSVINIIISIIIPVINIGKISPIEGVKNGGEIKTRVKKRNSKMLTKIFGYNGLLAYKNIRGNNRSFLITTITSTIILTIFIVFSGYSNNRVIEYRKDNTRVKDVALDINVKYDNYNQGYNGLDKYKKEVENLGIAKEVFGRDEYFLNCTFENVTLNKWMNSDNHHDSIDKKSNYSEIINLMIMDDNSLEEILPLVKNNELKLKDFKENGVLISDRMVAKNFINMERELLFNFKDNDKFTIKIKNQNHVQNNKNINLKYLGSINIQDVIDGVEYGDIITLIVSKDFYNNNKDLFMKTNEETFLGSRKIRFALNLKPNIDREVAVRCIANYSNQTEGDYIDNKLSNWKLESDAIVLFSMVYLVMFLTMIVGGLNLINNKNINIKLRSKEMGTLLALGVNKKKLKKILMLEGIIQWFISTVVSLILSYTILSILYKIMIYNGKISTVNMPVIATIFGCGVLFVINILGSYLPIRKLKYTNTTELIRNQE